MRNCLFLTNYFSGLVMKNTFTVLSFLFTLLVISLPLKGQSRNYNTVYADSELVIKEIDPAAFLVIHSFPWPANSFVLKFDNGNYLFLDTPYTDEATEKLVNWLKSRDSSNIHISAINTHFHMDNLGGNGYLKSIGSDIYGSDLTVKLLKERGVGNGMLESMKGPQMEKYYSYYKNKVFTPPSKLFSLEKGLKLNFGKDTVEVWYPGPGHTPDNVTVYYPVKKLLFGGCLVKSLESKSKGNTGDADLKKWSGSLENLLVKYPDAELVIPGHGKEGGVELIKHSINTVK